MTLSSESSSKYSLSHSSKSVDTVSGLLFTTTVFSPSCLRERMADTAHQSNSTLLPRNDHFSQMEYRTASSSQISDNLIHKIIKRPLKQAPIIKLGKSNKHTDGCTRHYSICTIQKIPPKGRFSTFYKIYSKY